MCPSTDPENATPGIALTAADCAGLQRSRPLHAAGGGVYHTRWPVSSRSANIPPPCFGSGIGGLAVGHRDAADVRQRHVDVATDRPPSPTARRR